MFRAVQMEKVAQMKSRAKCPDLIPVKPVYSVKELCCQLGISRALFYRLLQEGKGPRILKAGKRTLITNEAAEEWKHRMERAA
jgi:excisionase family DNA binding protein